MNISQRLCFSLVVVNSGCGATVTCTHGRAHANQACSSILHPLVGDIPCGKLCDASSHKPCEQVHFDDTVGKDLTGVELPYVIEILYHVIPNRSLSKV